MKIVDFDNGAPAERIGGKGHALCKMWQAGLPVPAGFCVVADAMQTIQIDELRLALNKLQAPSFAVRSSATQEDRIRASFAGIYPTHLNVRDGQSVLQALHDIAQSALAPAAMAYAERRRLPECDSVAAVVQVFISADAAGVLFTRDPIDGSDCITVEASWGLGEAVVAGLVQPDRWLLSPAGEILKTSIADKDIAIVPDQNGGVRQVNVEGNRRRCACVNHDSLQQLSYLAQKCETLFGSPQDIEWTIASNTVWLLQSRPVTYR